MQVLALEAYAKRYEKLLQLLGEFRRRLDIRVAHAKRMSVSAAHATTCQGSAPLRFCSLASLHRAMPLNACAEDTDTSRDAPHIAGKRTH